MGNSRKRNNFTYNSPFSHKVIRVVATDTPTGIANEFSKMFLNLASLYSLKFCEYEVRITPAGIVVPDW